MNAAERHAIERERIDATKGLSLDQRIAIVDAALADLGIDHKQIGDGKPVSGATASRRLSDWLKRHGHEPMMFAAACRVVLSRRS